jgi:hypothetical protein
MLVSTSAFKWVNLYRYALGDKYTEGKICLLQVMPHGRVEGSLLSLWIYQDSHY